MKNLAVKKTILYALVLTMGVVFLASCSRGYGCPYKMQAKVETKK